MGSEIWIQDVSSEGEWCNYTFERGEILTIFMDIDEEARGLFNIFRTTEPLLDRSGSAIKPNMISAKGRKALVALQIGRQ